MSPEKKITSQVVANEILETTMLMSLLGGNGDDNRIGRMAKARMRFRTSGSVEDGNLTYSYTFPDGTKGEYKLMHGTFSPKTGFQAGAFEKTLTKDGQKHSSIKLVFPGTAKRNQFEDLNSVDTFWLKRIGSQIHNVNEWMETEVIPRIPRNTDKKIEIEISGHCLGTQGALWAKAFLEEQQMNVTGLALIEPTAPGLVIKDLTDEIKQIYGISSREAIQAFYHNIYSVFVDPPTIVCPFGHGNMWDTVPVGEQSFTAHLPPTKLYEELNKAARSPHTFRKELREKEPEVLKDMEEKRRKEVEKRQKALDAGNEDVPPLPPPKKLSKSALQTKAFFKTALGVELEQQFFKNHYLLALSDHLLPEKATPDNPAPKPKSPEKFITEGTPPDAAAMLAHTAPDLGKDIEPRLKQLVTALLVDTGRDIANIVTQPCLKGGRMGVPSIIANPEESKIWSTSQIQTEDDSREGNYPPPFCAALGNHMLHKMITEVTSLTARLERGSASGQHLAKDLGSIMQVLGIELLSPLQLDVPGSSVNEVQARAIVKKLPVLRSDLQDCAREVPAESTVCKSAILALDEANKNLRRGYNIKPEHDITRYR